VIFHDVEPDEEDKMKFEARELKPYIETVGPENLLVGQVYFSVSFVDNDMLMPILLSLVFVGRNLDPEDNDKYYFQDLCSFSAGVRYETVTEEEPATFHTGDIINSIQHYDQALDELLRCSIRRSEAGMKV
jgi:hypothetical protein